jgi:enoyl-CoA hydratase/carnithine racemase
MIEIEARAGFWRLRINRPEKANSLTRTMLVALEEAVAGAKAAGARVLVLAGTDKVFSAGADLDEARAGLATDPVWERLSAAVVDFPGLTVAALNGSVAGGALGMVLACDLRVATAESGKIFYPVMKLGFLPQPSDPGRLAALVGPARAKLLLMAGVRVTMEEALDWGLIDRLAAPGTLDDEVARLAADALGADGSHVAAIKRMF